MQTTRSTRWGLQLATYNITFEWISGACNKAADFLSCLVELPQDTPVPINMLSVTNSYGPTFNTRNKTHQHLSLDTSSSQLDITQEVSDVTETYTKIPNSRQTTRLPYRCRKLTLLQKNIKTIVKWESATTSN